MSNSLMIRNRSKGILRYSPKLVGDRSEKWWLVLDCDNNLAKYYRHLFLLGTYRCYDIQMPSWKAHVTVVRDEEPPLEKQSLWLKYQGREIQFEYDCGLRDNGLYFWLDVFSEELFDIREELGLDRNPVYNFHLTVGNCVNLQSPQISV